MPRGSGRRIAAAVIALTLGWAAIAAAQSPAALLQNPGFGAGFQPTDNRFILAPEFRLTTFDGHAATLVGAYAGAIQERKLLFGVGAYTLVSGARKTRGLTYGGLMVGWLFNEDRRASLLARTLIGYGHISEIKLFGPVPLCDVLEGQSCDEGIVAIKFPTQFLLIEPEIGFASTLNNRFRLTGSAGYRFGTRSNVLDPNPRGATGSVSLVLGL